MQYVQWRDEYWREAQRDHNELLAVHLKRLGVCPIPELKQEWQADVIAACLFLSERSEQAKREFLARQRYVPRTEDGGTYVVTLGHFEENFARIVVSGDLIDIDFADLYGTPWDVLQAVGFDTAWITRVDGQPLGALEVQSLERDIEEDLLYDFDETEISFYFVVDEGFEALKLHVQDREEQET